MVRLCPPAPPEVLPDFATVSFAPLPVAESKEEGGTCGRLAKAHAGTQEVGSRPLLRRAQLHGHIPSSPKLVFHTGGELRASNLIVSECVTQEAAAPGHVMI